MIEIHYEKLPDVVNCSPDKRPFTQIPNEILRDPELSYKAKGILALLLSNKEGWKTCITTLCKMSSDGLTAIHTGIQELEQSQYVKRIRYRDKRTKQYIGSFWGITDSAGRFKLHETVKWIKSQGWEVVWPKYIEKPDVENLYVGNVDVENQVLKRTIIKRTKNNNNNISFSPTKKHIPLKDDPEHPLYQYYQEAAYLSKIIQTNKNIRPHTPATLNSWSKEIKSLSKTQGIPIPRIHKALEWYETNIGCAYVPVIESGGSLKEKFLKLEAAVERGKQSGGNGKNRFEYDEGSYSNPNNKTVYPKGRSL